MYQLILFDLDGTLLPLDMDVFIRKYFAAYSGTSGRRIRRHPDRCTGIIRTAFPVVSGHLVEYVF